MPTKKSLKQEIVEKNHRKTHGEDTRHVQNALKKFQVTKNKEHEKKQKQMNLERTNTKVKQRTLYKKIYIYMIKEDRTKYERGVEQRYGKPQKKRIKQKSWKKKSL
jgi:hypothetical protein